MPNGRRFLGALAAILLVFALAGPLPAEVKTFDLVIPGCTA